MVKLYEFSSTLHVVLQEWLGDEIMHPLGDQTWIDMSEEWAEFMFGEGNNQALCDGCHFAAAESPLRSVIPSGANIYAESDSLCRNICRARWRPTPCLAFSLKPPSLATAVCTSTPAAFLVRGLGSPPVLRLLIPMSLLPLSYCFAAPSPHASLGS